ncbi:MAG TPA: CoA-binding protein [Ferruginibacter sp.]|nr:CoA-binding protein [Ferruginibacter sp.]
MPDKKTLVLGASETPSRYSNMAMRSLKAKGHTVLAVGKKEGRAHGIDIHKSTPPDQDIDTVTLYLNPSHQQGFYHYLVALKPRRVIFNPGAENPELEDLLTAQGIQPIEACTLVMLSTGQY